MFSLLFCPSLAQVTTKPERNAFGSLRPEIAAGKILGSNAWQFIVQGFDPRAREQSEKEQKDDESDEETKDDAHKPLAQEKAI